MTAGGAMTRGKTREEKLAELLGVSVEEIFNKIPIPESSFELAARINKKKALGLDVSVEESLRKGRLLALELKRIEKEIKSEPALMPEQISKLASLAKGVFDDLQSPTLHMGVERGPDVTSP